MLVISCDPGLTGAIALIDSARGLLACEDLPTCSNGTVTGSMKRWVDNDLLDQLLAQWSTLHQFAQHSVFAVIERPIPMPSLPAQTIASQFDTFGAVRAAMARRVPAAHMRYVNPNEWKKLFGLHRDKDSARATCLRLYPNAQVQRVKDHNRAEAILVGHFLLREVG
jgi:hypothetical protein